MALELADVLPSIFMAGDKNDPRVNAQLRQRMALTMMAQKKAFPKNLGEGLTAIGDAIGDRAQMRQLMDADVTQQDAALRATGAGAAAPAAAPPVTRGAPVMNYGAEGGDPPVVADAPPPPPQQSVLTTAPQQPASMLGGSLPPTLSGNEAPPSPLTPQQNASYLNPQPTPMMSPGTAADTAAAVPLNPEQATIRDALAAQMVGRQRAAGGPPPNPLLAGAVPASISAAAPSPSAPAAGSPAPDQRLALNAPQDARGAVTDIRPAPPAPSQIRQEPPPQQVAQAQQLYPPGYVPPPAADPAMPPTVQMHPRERQLRNLIAQNPGNQYYATAAAPELQALTLDREKRQAYADELFKSKLTRGATQDTKRLEGQMDQASRIANVDTTRQEQEKRKLEIEDAREKSTLQARLGGRAPEQFFTEFDKEKENASHAVNALNQYAVVRDMIDKGVITGTAQGWKVNAYKLAGAFGIKSASEAVARTQEMEAALKSTLSLAVENIQGAGGKVSDTDVKVASGTIGADPAMQLEAIRNLTNRAEKLARKKLDNFEDQRDYYLGGTRSERRYQMTVPETAPAPHVKALLDNRDDDAAKAEFDRRFGHGASDLELARAKRRERRGG